MQNSVSTFGKKKTATAVCQVKAGKGIVNVNGCPVNTMRPEILRNKVFEPLEIIGKEALSTLDIRVKVTGGGSVAQIYAVRQAIARGVVAYQQKYVDEVTKNETKAALVALDRSLLIADPRRVEVKKANRKGARACYTTSYR